MISVQTELGRSANSSDISNDGLFSIASAMVDPKHLLEYFGWNSPLPKCLFNLRHRAEIMPQFGFYHNILYGHIMRLLGPLHTSFENVGNHQAIYLRTHGRGNRPQPGASCHPCGEERLRS